MKYLLLLFLGLSIGISGEMLIPKKFYVTVGGGCFAQKENGLVFMPQLIIYNPKLNPYPRQYGGHEMDFVPSYRYAYALLTGEISHLNQDECNKLIQKFIDGERK
jgi:hypothetical protein